jgi:AraC-like DNA-binding protein
MSLSNDLVLMGTDNGISILNTKTGQWQHSCQGTVVLGTGVKPGGGVLVSTYGKGIYEIDSRANVSRVYTTENSLLTDDHVYATLYDKDGGLWVGTLDGDLLYKPASNLPPRYYPMHDVQAITQLASGQIAVGTAFGLKLITPGNDNIKELNYAPSGVADVNPFVNHLLTSGLELWIATDGGGVYVYHLAKHESRQITTDNGLPSNYVRSLAKGRDGRIWIATIEGLSFVAPEAPEKVVNVNYCYGLDCEYSRGAAQNLPDGDIIFGTTTGAIIIHPENVQSVNYTVQLVILGVDCDVEQDRLQTEEVATDLEKGWLHLSYRQRTFDLLFESVNMRNHYDIAYRYKMGQGEWSQPIDQQYIRFVDVEPGKHQLTLQCISRTSGTILDSKTLMIVISRPWWNSWWMWCVYLTFIILAFFAAWKVYELHEKYMRLTIDHLQTVENAPKAALYEEMKLPHAAAEQIEPVESADSDEANQDFVNKATRLIAEHLSDSEFNIDRLCREMAMSRTLFYVKLKSYTGKSPQDFIRIIRLERASALLRSGRNVTDVAALTGFDNPKYFSTVFKKYFGVSPSKYQ